MDGDNKYLLRLTYTHSNKQIQITYDTNETNNVTKTVPYDVTTDVLSTIEQNIQLSTMQTNNDLLAYVDIGLIKQLMDAITIKNNILSIKFRNESYLVVFEFIQFEIYTLTIRKQTQHILVLPDDQTCYHIEFTSLQTNRQQTITDETTARVEIVEVIQRTRAVFGTGYNIFQPMAKNQTFDAFFDRSHIPFFKQSKIYRLDNYGNDKLRLLNKLDTNPDGSLYHASQLILHESFVITSRHRCNDHIYITEYHIDCYYDYIEITANRNYTKQIEFTRTTNIRDLHVQLLASLEVLAHECIKHEMRQENQEGTVTITPIMVMETIQETTDIIDSEDDDGDDRGQTSRASTPIPSFTYETHRMDNIFNVGLYNMLDQHKRDKDFSVIQFIVETQGVCFTSYFTIRQYNGEQHGCYTVCKYNLTQSKMEVYHLRQIRPAVWKHLYNDDYIFRIKNESLNKHILPDILSRAEFTYPADKFNAEAFIFTVPSVPAAKM